MTVTARTLVALLAVPSIHDILLTRVVFAETSLVALVQSLEPESRTLHRRLRAHLTAADAAHGSIVALLDYLAAHAGTLERTHLRLEVAREDMVQTTYPRGIAVKDLITESDLQQRIAGIEASVPTSMRFHLTLRVVSFGAEKPRHAICEMVLRINDEILDDDDDDEHERKRVACLITRTQVPRYKRKTGRIA